jgi:hypothetical protein
MTEELGITAWLPENLSISTFEKNNHPSKVLYQEMLNQKNEDFHWCLQKLQCHKCSAFCMRKHHIL